GSLTDITERKLIEEGLRESEERHRELVENINDVIFMADAQGIVTYVSPVNEWVTGYHPTEVIGRPFSEFIHPDDLPGVLKSHEQTTAGAVEPLEYRVLIKDGSVRWMRSSSRRVMQGDRFVGVRGVMTDITARRHAEELLRKSEERYRELV